MLLTEEATASYLPATMKRPADTRILFHVQDALQQESKTCFVRTVDTDVIIIVIGKFYHLRGMRPTLNIWVGFGTGRSFSYIHINALALTLDKEMSTALPVFHNFTGCDTVLVFLGKGKRCAWETWKSFPDVTKAFNDIASHPFKEVDISDENFKLLERFTVLMHQKTSGLETE